MKHITTEIQAWLSGELTADQNNHFEAHLKACAECASEVAEAKLFWDALKSCEIPETDLESSLWPAVRKQTFGRNESDEKGAWFFGTGRWLQVSLATATVAAGLIFGVLFPGGGTPSVGGQVEAADLTTDQLESLWLGGSSWEGGYTQLESGWWSVGANEIQNEIQNEGQADNSTATGVEK